MTGALSGIRVLDMSRVLAGPWVGQTLGDLGADVIKIERPGSGDDTRHWGPPYVKNPDGTDSNDATYFCCTNRNKRSVTVDITTTGGQQLIRELVAASDIVIENYKVGGLKKYGLDYNGLCAVKPDLIYCSITGFGQTGPYASRAGYDFMIQGMGGLMSVTGIPETGPVKVGVAMSDLLTGLYASVGILAALNHRNQTGEGQYLDMALLDSTIAGLANQSSGYLLTGNAPTLSGNAHPSIVPYQTFETTDGHIIIAIGNDRQFGKFCTIANCEHLALDPQYATNTKRVLNRDVLVPILIDIVSNKSLDWWMENLSSAGVPCGPINSIDKVFDDEQVKSRNIHIETPRSDGSMIPGVASPIRLSKTPPSYRSAPPGLGEHTEDVLRSVLNKSDEDIQQLAQSGTITIQGTSE